MPTRTTKISLNRSISDFRHHPHHWASSNNLHHQQPQPQQQPARGRSAAVGSYKSRYQYGETTTTLANGLLTATPRYVDPATTTAVTTTSVAESSSSSLLLLSPLYETPGRAGNYDNVPPTTTTTLHAGRTIPITIEEDQTPASVCQQSRDAPLQSGDPVPRGTARSRPVTARRSRVSVHGRTVSMPSRGPVNVDAANDSERHPPRLIAPTPTCTSSTAKIGPGQVKAVAAASDVGIPEISISLQGDGGVTSNATVTDSTSGRPTIASRRSMSHVTPDFDPPPPHRFDPPPPLVTSRQVSAASRQIHADDHRSVRPRRTRDDPDAAGKADLDAARRRYFSIAEWNRQKVLHLRRASLRRACLTGIPLSWTQRGGPQDRRQSRDGATTNCRRRQRQGGRQTEADGERRKPQTAEIQTKSHGNQSLPPISEKPSVTSNGGRAGRRRGTSTKSDYLQNLRQDLASLNRPIAYTYLGRCPAVRLPAQLTRPTYATSHRTRRRSPRKEPPEVNEQTVTAQAQQKPEANDSGMESDAAARGTIEHQSVTAANVDLQKVKDVLENPPSRGRMLNDDENDEDGNNETTCDKNNVASSNSLELAENDRREAARLTVTDSTRYEYRDLWGVGAPGPPL